MKFVKYTVFTIIFLVICFSCLDKKVIYYTYKGVTITRVDEANIIRFYYGRFSLDTVRYLHSYVEVTYHGFNSGMSAYMYFDENKDVKIGNETGSWKQVGNDNEKLYIISPRRDDEPAVDSSKLWRYYEFRDRFENVIFISDIWKEETNKNQGKTKVESTYSTK